jgi:hypothetical protein
MDKHRVVSENAELVWKWLKTRGGIAVWGSVNLSNPGASWTAPLNTEDGNPSPKPTWQAANSPGRVITDAGEVEVCIPKEVKRFRIAVRRGSQGLSWKVTDAGSKRIRDAVEKAYETYMKESWHRFDYETQEAVIMIDDVVVPMEEYARERGWSNGTE